MRNPSLTPMTLLFLAAIVMATARPAFPQTFEKITDPNNPVVTEARQSGGGSWIDLLGDGYLDLFVANGNLSNEPNALYRNDRAGGFVRVVTGNVVTDGGSSIGGTVGDFDNDGFPDVFVTNRQYFGNFLYRGLGDSLFAKITIGPPIADIGNSNSSSWVDLDGDGDLDLYVVNFNSADFLYLNGGGPGWNFTRVDTTALTAGAEFSIPGAWADYNGDGRDDLFIGNAGTQSDYLYTNHGNLHFTRTVLADGGASLGASWGDFNNDGYLDLLVPHFLGQKNRLYRNGGPPLFQMVPVDTGIVSNDAGSWVGSSWGDCDNDGDLDLYVANDGAAGALYRNDGPPGYGFTKVTTGPVATDTGNSFGAVWGDYDRDGQLDLFVANRAAQGNRLFRNLGTPDHWLTVRCVGTASNRSAIGARIRLHATIGGVPRVQARQVTGQTGYNSGNLDQHFGLGDAAVVDSITIAWPSGLEETFRGLAADRFLKLTEGSALSVVEEPPPVRDRRLRLDPAVPNPFHNQSRFTFSLPARGRARLEVFDLAGRRVAVLAEGELAAGPHTVSFTAGADLPNGVYFARLTAAGGVRTSRVILAR